MTPAVSIVVPLFNELGYHVLIIKYRNDVGEARDPSGFHQYGVTEWVEVAGAVTYARDNGADRHVLYGYSMGGAIVTSYLTQSPLRNFTEAAILDSPMLSLEETIEFRAESTRVSAPRLSRLSWIARQFRTVASMPA